MTDYSAVRVLDRTTPPHLVTLILLAGVSALSMSIFLPSLNGMTAYFNTDYRIMQWAVSGYFATTAILQLLFGPLSDRFGRRPILLVTLGIFVLATFGAIFAPNVGTFLFFRVLQAAVASCMALSRAVVRDTHTTEQAASQIGYLTMGMALVPMVGPLIGGLLDEAFDWRASFLFLGLTGAAIFALTYFDLGETYRGQGGSFRDQVRSYPELIRSQRFWGYVACTAFTAGGFYALLGGASFVAGTVFELSPSITGLAIGSPAIGYALGNFLSGRYSIRFGINMLALTGSIITLVTMTMSLGITIAGYASAWGFFGFCTLMGLGNGLTMPNATTGSLSVRPHLSGTASGLGAAIMMGGGAGVSAFAGTMLDPDLGVLPLNLLMFATSILALVSILYVIRRARIVGDDF